MRDANIELQPPIGIGVSGTSRTELFDLAGQFALKTPPAAKARPACSMERTMGGWRVFGSDVAPNQ